MYNTDSLKNGIKACEKNIKTFEDAIAKEHEQIKEYEFMIEKLEEKARIAEGVTIDAKDLIDGHYDTSFPEA